MPPRAGAPARGRGRAAQDPGSGVQGWRLLLQQKGSPDAPQRGSEAPRRLIRRAAARGAPRQNLHFNELPRDSCAAEVEGDGAPKILMGAGLTWGSSLSGRRRVRKLARARAAPGERVRVQIPGRRGPGRGPGVGLGPRPPAGWRVRRERGAGSTSRGPPGLARGQSAFRARDKAAAPAPARKRRCRRARAGRSRVASPGTAARAGPGEPPDPHAMSRRKQARPQHLSSLEPQPAPPEVAAAERGEWRRWPRRGRVCVRSLWGRRPARRQSRVLGVGGWRTGSPHTHGPPRPLQVARLRRATSPGRGARACHLRGRRVLPRATSGLDRAERQGCGEWGGSGKCPRRGAKTNPERRGPRGRTR